jgi:peptidoglycan/xylan/chitin deacetylase (PgdA/CDA1 family)
MSPPSAVPPQWSANLLQVDVRRLFRRALIATGWPAWRIRQRRFPGMLVLSYHAIKPSGPGASTMAFSSLHVTAAQFETHCRILASLCNPISLDDWRAHRDAGRPLAPRPVLVTFDDGYRSVLTEALPVLERHGVPAVIFACTGPIESGTRFWYDAVAASDGEAAVEDLKAADHASWRMRVDAAREPAGHDDPHAPLTIDELTQLAAHPLIEVGAHTVRHPILARAPLDAQRGEIRDSLAAVTSWTGSPITAFAYPNGREEVDFDESTVRELADAGVTDAFTTAHIVAPFDCVRLRVPRLVVVDGWTGDVLIRLLLSLTVDAVEPSI